MLAFVGSEIGRFWTIMSMLAPTSATTAETQAAMPGLFGVGDGDLVLRAIVAIPNDGLFHGVSLGTSGRRRARGPRVRGLRGRRIRCRSFRRAGAHGGDRSGERFDGRRWRILAP